MMDLKNLFDKRIEEFILVLTTALIVSILFTQSILRFFGGFSLSWGAELAQFLHIRQIGAERELEKGVDCGTTGIDCRHP